MSGEHRSAAIVAAVTLPEARNFSGPLLRPDGNLAIVIRGSGLVVGPLQPSELRSFAMMALAVAGQLEEQADQAAASADRQLAAIVEGSAHG